MKECCLDKSLKGKNMVALFLILDFKERVQVHNIGYSVLRAI
jgi:hypothetical protein